VLVLVLSMCVTAATGGKRRAVAATGSVTLVVLGAAATADINRRPRHSQCANHAAAYTMECKHFQSPGRPGSNEKVVINRQMKDAIEQTITNRETASHRAADHQKNMTTETH
jgi:hypothetical protein